jgi:NAD(P)-dependent dehydrogenase (short-subunit alcohol dehydrogenase family)
MGNYLVVGGSSGIGLQVVNDLAEQGHRVHATYHQHPIQNNGSVSYHPLNVLEENLDLGFLDTPLDGLVFCPGAINLKPFARITPSDFIADYQLQIKRSRKCIHCIILDSSSASGFKFPFLGG